MPKQKLITGLFYPSLEKALLEEVKRCKESDPLGKIIIIIPNHLVGLYISRFLGEKTGGVLNLCTLTFYELARGIALYSFLEDGRTELPVFSMPFLLKEIINSGDIFKDSYFSNICYKKGFPKALASTITDIKNANIPPEIWGTSFPPGQKKLLDIGYFYRLYENRLRETKLFDCEDLIKKATLLLRSSVHTDFGDNTKKLFVYGFYRFSSLQKDFLEAIFSKLGSTVFIPWKDNPVLSSVRHTINWLINIGFSWQKREEKGDFPSALCLLREKLFSDSSVAPDENQSVCFLSTSDKVTESEEITREIFKKAKEGIFLSDIAILMRNPELYQETIKDCLDIAHIPFYIHRQQFKGHPYVKSLILLLNIPLFSFTRAHVIEFATSGLVDFNKILPPDMIRGAIPSQWDRISMEAGIVEGLCEWRTRLLNLPSPNKDSSSNEDGPLSIARKSLSCFIETLARFLTPLTEKMGFNDILLKSLDAYQELTRSSKERERIEDILTSLYPLHAIKDTVTLDEFIEIVVSAFEYHGYSSGRFEEQGVTLTDLESAVCLPFPVVIIPGMFEHSFPRSKYEDPLLLDKERICINKIMHDLGEKGEIPLRAEKREEKLLFYLATTLAQRSLILTFPRRSLTKGREEIPSGFILETLKALGQSKSTYSSFPRLSTRRCFPDDPTQAISALEYDLYLAERSIAGDSKKRSMIEKIYPHFAESIRAMEFQWKQDNLTVYEGLLTSPKAQKILKENFDTNLVFPVSQMETYARCPFKYMMQYILRIPLLDEPTHLYTVTPQQRGTLIHRIIYRFFNQLTREKEFPMDSTKSDKYHILLKDIAKEEIEFFAAKNLTCLPVMWDMEQTLILENLEQFLEKELLRESGYIPKYFEVSFGMDNKDMPNKPVTIDLGNDRKIYFKGRIDRIDLTQDNRSAKVIDYKTGKSPKNTSPDRFNGGETIQLPIYLLAVDTMLSQDISTEAEYLYIGDGYTQVVFSKDDWDFKMAKLKEICETITHGIEKGIFPQYPEPYKCKYCEYKGPCLPTRFIIFETKQKDPRMMQFLKIKEIL